MNPIGFLVGFVIFVLLATYAVYKWFEIYNGPNGERYRRMLSQGPYVPLTTEDIEQDNQRIAARKTTK